MPMVPLSIGIKDCSSPNCYGVANTSCLRLLFSHLLPQMISYITIKPFASNIFVSLVAGQLYSNEHDLYEVLNSY